MGKAKADALTQTQVTIIPVGDISNPRLFTDAERTRYIEQFQMALAQSGSEVSSEEQELIPFRWRFLGCYSPEEMNRFNTSEILVQNKHLPCIPSTWAALHQPPRNWIFSLNFSILDGVRTPVLQVILPVLKKQVAQFVMPLQGLINVLIARGDVLYGALLPVDRPFTTTERVAANRLFGAAGLLFSVSPSASLNVDMSSLIFHLLYEQKLRRFLSRFFRITESLSSIGTALFVYVPQIYVLLESLKLNSPQWSKTIKMAASESSDPSLQSAKLQTFSKYLATYSNMGFISLQTMVITLHTIVLLNQLLGLQENTLPPDNETGPFFHKGIIENIHDAAKIISLAYITLFVLGYLQSDNHMNTESVLKPSKLSLPGEVFFNDKNELILSKANLPYFINMFSKEMYVTLPKKSEKLILFLFFLCPWDVEIWNWVSQFITGNKM